MAQEFQIETSFGNGRVILHGPYSPPKGERGTLPALASAVFLADELTINRVVYNIRLDFALYADGWDMHRNSYGNGQYHTWNALYINRKDWKEASESARATARVKLVPIIIDAIKARPELIAQAQTDTRIGRVKELKEKLAEALELADDLRNKIGFEEEMLSRHLAGLDVQEWGYENRVQYSKQAKEETANG